jgi:hypothetical protein
MLWTILVVLVILWLLGFSLHVSGAMIHLLLVLAVVVLNRSESSAKKSTASSGRSRRSCRAKLLGKAATGIALPIARVL